MVPHLCPETPALRRNPAFFYLEDAFRVPVPFRADIAVNIDEVWERKLDALDAHASQVYEWLPWVAGQAVPETADARRKWLDAAWTANRACVRVRRSGGDTEPTQRRECATQRLRVSRIRPSAVRARNWTRSFPVDAMSKMLEEARDQPEALSRTLSGRHRQRRRAARALQQAAAASDRFGGAGNLRQCGAVRAIPDRDHYAHSGIAGRAVNLDTVRMPGGPARRGGDRRFRNRGNPPTPTRCSRMPADRAPPPSESRTTPPARWPGSSNSRC